MKTTETSAENVEYGIYRVRGVGVGGGGSWEGGGGGDENKITNDFCMI
jgi:hypothetical protein